MKRKNLGFESRQKPDSYREFHLVIHYEKKYKEVMNAFAKHGREK